MSLDGRPIPVPVVLMWSLAAACAPQQTLVVTSPNAPMGIVVPSNSYTPAQDVQLGREAAAQARKELPLLDDRIVASYVTSIGRRLVGAIPRELRHEEFRYSFSVVNAREIHAFALPGGPMFVNRGMLAAAANEGEVAGVMAHELSHVILRHGTAQASRATPYQAGEIVGQVLGAIVGGQVGGLIAQGSRFGITLAFMRYSRDFEKCPLDGACELRSARHGRDVQDDRTTGRARRTRLAE
jgi:predicted Zn-dependent protease